MAALVETRNAEVEQHAALVPFGFVSEKKFEPGSAVRL